METASKYAKELAQVRVPEAVSSSGSVHTVKPFTKRKESNSEGRQREGSSSKGQQRDLCLPVVNLAIYVVSAVSVMQCYKCGKVGHLQKACHSSDRGKFNRSNSFHKKAPKKTVHCLEEVADKGRWKPVVKIVWHCRPFPIFRGRGKGLAHSHRRSRSGLHPI